MAPIEGNFLKMSTELPAPPAAPAAAEQPEPKKKKGLPKWLTGIIAAVVVAGGVFAFNYFTDDVAQAKAGDCAKVSGTESKPEYSAAACDSADANAIVGKAMSNTSEACGGNGYLEFTQKASKGPDTKLCLVPRLEEGQCYKIDDTDSVAITKQACDANNIKVVKVVKDKADEALCGGEGGAAITFPEPASTYCLAPGA
jgi:hypothetical protein